MMRALWSFGPLALILLISMGPLAAQQSPTAQPQGSRDQVLAERLIEQINAFRRQQGLPSLSVSPALTRAAEMQSRDMVTYNFFDHNSPVPGHGTPLERALLAGYTSRTVAENLFYCMGTPQAAIPGQCFNTWVQSSGHLRNLLDTSRTEIGIGVASNNQDETYVTAVFGRP
jgi:uncharacterized protein YkwD